MASGSTDTGPAVAPIAHVDTSARGTAGAASHDILSQYAAALWLPTKHHSDGVTAWDYDLAVDEAGIRVVVPNMVSRWSSIVYLLIWLLGVYGVVRSERFSPDQWQSWLCYLALGLLPILGIRSARARVVLDRDGFASYSELGRKTYAWKQVVDFSTRGRITQNQVGVILHDGRWVLIQYHAFASDFVKQLQLERRKLQDDIPVANAG